MNNFRLGGLWDEADESGVSVSGDLSRSKDTFDEGAD